jgi:hypothetical protein
MSMHRQPPTESPEGNPFGESNPFSDNPYAPPRSTVADPSADLFAARVSSRKMVGHVPVVAVLMMVQGGLELLMGVFLAVMAGIFPLLMRMEGGQAGREGPPPEVIAWTMLAIYGSLGLLTIVAAVLHFLAGLRNYRFRSRTLGLVALAGGLVTVFSCYCAPTSVALAVYGLVTYLNADVGQAFQEGEAGRSRDEILRDFRNDAAFD